MIRILEERQFPVGKVKMVNETKKIMNDPSIAVTATAVRVPVFYGHSGSVNNENETEKKITADEVRELLAALRGVNIVDDPRGKRYPLAMDAANGNDTLVGRIREDESIPTGINMWIVTDNIRKGAALNAIQIAEILIKKYL